MPTKKKNDILTYKGKPLIRNGNTIYYGDYNDTHIVMLKIIESADINGIDTPTKVSVQLMLTDEAVSTKDRFIKKSEKANLYDAIDIAVIWLERALGKA